MDMLSLNSPEILLDHFVSFFFAWPFFSDRSELDELQSLL